MDGECYENIGPVMDATILSDDYYEEFGHGMFTGHLLVSAARILEARELMRTLITFPIQSMKCNMDLNVNI